MKKSILKIWCLACSFIILLTSCNSSADTNKKSDFNIDEEEYIISFSMVGGYAGNRYAFILTPDDKLLAENESGKSIQKVELKLNEQQIDSMKERIDEVLTLTEDNIEFNVGISDYWYCTIQYNDVMATFDYGASKSTTVNILLEQIIGCVDSEKSLETQDNLQPIPTLFRENMSYYVNFEEEEEE